MDITVKSHGDWTDLIVECDNTTVLETYHKDELRDGAKMLLDAFTDFTYEISSDLYYQLLAESLDDVEVYKLLAIVQGTADRRGE